ncbi:type II toxin-antitoxin system death-on-curing family toxin [Halorhabdus rudnickae]|uniref:type II toxin-antitoxin system death-on-curing family toxin n=1 Tax=Halorhabdus rudnickae TaxID=1775544 RepID=UPI0010843B70|nr:type II toxin-antitoxin system death-on-curing family toxin [Halorhabdus rudnickae]
MTTDDDLPTVEEIYTIHDEIIHIYDLKHPGVRDRFADEKLAQLIEEAREYDDDFQRAAVILRKLPSLHVFEDGNKRTAFLVVVEYLDRRNLEPAKSGDIVERVMKCRKRYSVEEIARWLEDGSIDEDKLRQ